MRKSLPRLLQHRSAALLALLVGLALTAALGWHTAARARREAALQFKGYADQITDNVARRVMLAEYGLLGIRSLWAVTGGVQPGALRTFVQGRDLPREFPGIRGFGWMELVPRAELDAWVERERAAQGPAFWVHGLAEAIGDDLLVVKYVEPLERNLAAWGLAGGPPQRRAAAERAIATGHVTLSAPLVLAQDERRGAGWLLFLPVFRESGMPGSEAQRRKLLLGLIYAPIAADEVLAPLRNFAEGAVQFQLYDGPAAEGTVLFDSRPRPARDAEAATERAPLMSEVRRIVMGDRELSVRIQSSPLHDAALGRQATSAVLAAGSLLSLLVALVIGITLRGRESAEARGQRLTLDLERMADVVEGTSSAVAELDADLHIAWVNRGFAGVVDRRRPELAGTAIDAWLQPVDPRLDLRREMQGATERNGTTRLELRHVRTDGAVRWLDTEVLPKRDESGNFTGVTLIAVDVSERRQAEARLADREHLIRLMTDNIPARLSYWDRDMRCRLANRTLGESYGRDAADLIGIRLDELVGDRYPAIEPHVAAAFRGERQEFEWATAAGEGRQTSLVYFVPDAPDGVVEGFFVFALDVTALKEAQEAALRASSAKSQFLSNMSHEIRTPMNAVIGMLALLRMTALDTRQSDYAAKAEAASQSLLSLLNDILDFSKIEAGKMALDPRPFAFKTLLDDLSVVLSPAVGDRPIALRFALDPEVPPWLLGDDMRLRQILINLGGNALKFTRAGSVEVAVTLVRLQDAVAEVELSVADTGIGISPADQQRIFSDFSQAAASTTREFGGTGLGLGICSRLAALMGTRLEVDSAEGRGSRFHFRIQLPLAQAPPAALPAPAAAAATKPLQGLRLLVAEDNPINQQVARELLQAAGAEVVLANNGREAVLAVAGKGTFDAVLMDLQMPVLDGLQATRDIRQRLAQHTLPIIAMTANALENDRQACLAAGMNDHVGKPFATQALIAKLLRYARPELHAAPVPAAAAAGNATPRTGLPVLDRSGAVAALGGDEALYASLVPMFRAELRAAQAQLPRLQDGMPRQDATRLLHTLKSTSASLGALRLSAAAAAAERSSHDASTALDSQLLAPLASEIEAAAEAFDALGMQDPARV